MKFLTFNNAMYPIMSKEEAINKMLMLAPIFIEALKNVLLEENLEKANFVGIGNSLVSGWSAVDSDVRPFVCKLGNVLENELASSGVEVNFRNYSTASKNSNLEILEFLMANPSEKDVLDRFIQDKMDWDRVFSDTLFRNYIDLEKAVEKYPNSDVRFMDNYRDTALTITLIDSCTGGFLNAFSKNSHYAGLLLDRIDEGIKEDLFMLELIIDYIHSFKASQNNIVVVGNFPYISTKVMGMLVNRLIRKLNEEIKKSALNTGAYYFDGNQVAFFQTFVDPETLKERVKVDNHPTMDEQYTVLYYYMEYLVELLLKKRGKSLNLVR